VGVAPGEPITTEQFAEFQDFAHAMIGVDAMYSFSDYDDEKAWVSRQRCFFGGSGPFTNAPPDLVSVCAFADLGFISAYKELQPQLLWRNVHNMASIPTTDADGPSICGSIMVMDIPENARERKSRSMQAEGAPMGENTSAEPAADQETEETVPVGGA
jgi:hypothetical protein